MTADRIIAAALAAAVCLPRALAACGTREAAVRAERADSAGIEIVTSPASERALDWAFTPRVQIGGADSGAASFWDISASNVAADAAGHIFVLDPRNYRLSAFETSGTVLWSTGRKGGGPGEFQSPFSVRVAGDSVGVLDFAGPNTEWFSGADGGYLGSARMTGFAVRSASTRVGEVRQYGEYPSGGASRDVLAYVRGNDTLQVASVTEEGERHQLKFPDCPVMINIGPILSPQLLWAAADDRVYVSTGVDYAISVYVDTNLATSLRRAVQPVPATAELAGAEYPDGFRVRVPSAGLECSVSGAEAAETFGFGSVVPAVRGLMLAPDGSLWVRRNPPRAKRATYDLFTPDGEYSGTLTDIPAPVTFLPDGSIVAIEKDDMDVTRIVVYAVEQS
jgi:hypothetical protein